MKKFLLCLFIIFSMLFSLLATVNATDEISVYLNGEKLVFDVSPVNINGRILVPFRVILEKLGAEVTFDKGNNFYFPKGIAIGKTRGKEIKIPIGENFLHINSCSIQLDVPAQIISGRTLVPIRAVSECMGAKVEWKADTQRVMITTSPETKIYWNDSYTYYGDAIFTGDSYIANGYGTLYKNDDNSILCSGYFENDFITKGTLYYSDGSYYTGKFSNTKFAFKHGDGFIEFNDGSILEGFWDNNVTEGDFHLFDAETNTHIYGKSVNGKWDGEITFYDYGNNTTYTQMYANGEAVSQNENISASSPYTYDPVIYKFTTAKYPLYLYSNDGKTFLGKLVTDKYDDESIFNTYGDYGSKYSKTSIFNEYGDYGSKYDDESVFNKYARKPPVIVDSNGQFIAFLTADEYNYDGITFLELMSILRQNHQ